MSLSSRHSVHGVDLFHGTHHPGHQYARVMYNSGSYADELAPVTLLAGIL